MCSCNLFNDNDKFQKNWNKTYSSNQSHRSKCCFHECPRMSFYEYRLTFIVRFNRMYWNEEPEISTWYCRWSIGYRENVRGWYLIFNPYYPSNFQETNFTGFSSSLGKGMNSTSRIRNGEVISPLPHCRRLHVCSGATFFMIFSAPLTSAFSCMPQRMQR